MQNFAKLGLGSEGEHSISRMFSNAVIGSEYETRLSSSSEWYRVWQNRANTFMKLKSNFHDFAKGPQVIYNSNYGNGAPAMFTS